MHIVAIALILLHLGIAGCIRLHSAQVTAALHSLNSPEYLQVKSVVTKQTQSLSSDYLYVPSKTILRLLYEFFSIEFRSPPTTMQIVTFSFIWKNCVQNYSG